MKNKIPFFLELLLFLIIAFFSIKSVENYDFWFHVKYGEYIVNTGKLPFTDVFSHSAYGRPAVPYEWLFQIVIFLIYRTFGALGVQILVVGFLLGYLLLFRQILKEIFDLPFLTRFFLTGLLFVLGYDFWVERPQTVAYFLFMAVFYLLAKRVFLGRNWLLLTLPIFLIWTNLHASMILGLYLFFSLGAIAFIRYLQSRNLKDKKLASDLFLYGFLNTFITLLPPLGIKVYQLLYLFFEKRDFISTAISEWVPLWRVSFFFYLFVFIIVGALISYFWVFFKKDEGKKNIFYYLPFIPLGLFALSGIRQAPFTMPVIFLLFTPILKDFKARVAPFFSFVLAVVIMVITLGILFYYRRDNANVVLSYPKQAMPFVRENLKGNMFNEYAVGGYLMYSLGPKQKTFIDGRTDMFLPKVLPDYIGFSNMTLVEDGVYLARFNELVVKYNISWAILTTNRFGLSSRLSRILSNDSSWRLVYFDDKARIYVKDDRVNSNVIEKFGMKAATPFLKKIYREGQRDLAREEYKKMFGQTKSAVSSNALGFLLLEEGKFEEAKRFFLEALEIDSRAGPPKMNLAEIYAKDGDLQKAIRLYREAIKDDPERGIAYLRLGQLIVASGGSREEAQRIWKKGLKSTYDDEIYKKIQKEIDSK